MTYLLQEIINNTSLALDIRKKIEQKKHKIRIWFWPCVQMKTESNLPTAMVFSAKMFHISCVYCFDKQLHPITWKELPKWHQMSRRGNSAPLLGKLLLHCFECFRRRRTSHWHTPKRERWLLRTVTTGASDRSLFSLTRTVATLSIIHHEILFFFFSWIPQDSLVTPHRFDTFDWWYLSLSSFWKIYRDT